MCKSEQTKAYDEGRLLRMAGLAVKAGKVIFGTPMVCDAMRAGKTVKLVIEAGNTSENTHKRITDKCAYYGVPHIRVESDTEAFARVLGKSGDLAVAAVTDTNFSNAIRSIFSQP